ncbi:MAG TPA: acyl-CoA dehydrogenase family protein [Acidimicrobiales bacterium]|nr:acyl-CoA dehydrogenase family protein [Acidimicrobiales bacterium]
MDFTYDAEQLALQDVARTALERECPPGLLRELADDPIGITPALWSTLVDLGWTGLLVPEAFGGTGAGLLEICIVAEQMGRVPLPGPFFSSAVGATLAARALGATELLEDLAAGERRGTIALLEQGHGDPLGTVRTRARRRNAEWVVTGTKPVVVDGHSADWVIVVARSEEGVRSYLLENPSAAESASAELVPSLDPTRKIARLVLDETPVVPLGPSGSQAGLWQRVQDDIAIVLAAEIVGAGDRALAEAISYTSTRVVFDKPVATYQTIRHRLVEMFQQVEMARAGMQFAAWASDTGSPERAQAAAMAASYAADAGVRVAGEDIQMHGGVGFTWANDAHFLFKRVKQNEVLFGGAGHERHRLASMFLEPVSAPAPASASVSA